MPGNPDTSFKVRPRLMKDESRIQSDLVLYLTWYNHTRSEKDPSVPIARQEFTSLVRGNQSTIFRANHSQDGQGGTRRRPNCFAESGDPLLKPRQALTSFATCCRASSCPSLFLFRICPSAPCWVERRTFSWGRGWLCLSVCHLFSLSGHGRTRI